MRILVCVKHDLFGALALNRLLPALSGHDVRLVFGERTRAGEDSVPELRLARLLERTIPVDGLFPRLDDRTDRSPGSLLTFREMARHLGCTGLVVTNLKRDDGARVFHALEPDLIISIRFSFIFPPSLIGMPSQGILNVHPGRLPDYGGLFAPFRQMLRGESWLGCTVHWVDEGIDTGPILAVAPVRPTPGRSMMWHAARLYEAGVDETCRLVARIAAGDRPTGTAQDPARRHYYPYPTPEEFRAFARQGHALATWSDYRELLSAFDPGAEPEALFHAAGLRLPDLAPGIADARARRTASAGGVPC